MHTAGESPAEPRAVLSARLLLCGGSEQAGMEEDPVWVAEAGWCVLPISRQQMAMSPCENCRQGEMQVGACCTGSLGTGDK